MLAGRSLSKILSAPLKQSHYVALIGMFRTYHDVGASMYRYLRASDDYPVQVRLRTPIGTISATLYSWHDMLTVNEVFCRNDYPASRDIRVVVDFGSNIGITALYFLTRNHDCKVYLWEPLERNAERLRLNCLGYEERYELSTYAVGLCNEAVEFSYEATGRYGGIGLCLPDSVKVQCRDAREEIDRILTKHGTIDILKIDVEGMESQLIKHLTRSETKRIKRIYAECHKFEDELVGFSKRTYSTVVQFVNEQA